MSKGLHILIFRRSVSAQRSNTLGVAWLMTKIPLLIFGLT
jgi:hypothetical protein